MASNQNYNIKMTAVLDQDKLNQQLTAIKQKFNEVKLSVSVTGLKQAQVDLKSTETSTLDWRKQLELVQTSVTNLKSSSQAIFDVYNREGTEAQKTTQQISTAIDLLEANLDSQLKKQGLITQEIYESYVAQQKLVNSQVADLVPNSSGLKYYQQALEALVIKMKTFESDSSTAFSTYNKMSTTAKQETTALEVRINAINKDISEQLALNEQLSAQKVQAILYEKTLLDAELKRIQASNAASKSGIANSTDLNNIQSSATTDALRNKLILLQNELTKTELTSKNVFKLYETGGTTAQAKTQAVKTKIAELNAELTKQLAIQGQLDKVTINGLSNQLRNINSDLSLMRTEVNSTGNSLTKMFANMVKFATSTLVFSGMTTAVYKSVSAVFELDKALTEVNKVASLTEQQMDSLTESAFEIGAEIGRTGTEIVNAVAEFSRAGYDLEDSLDLSRTAVVLTNVADGIDDTGDAAQNLISILKGFGLATSEADNVLDLINYTSNTSATSFSGLTDVLVRSSATMKQAGNTLNETIALGVGALEILGTDQSERIGRGLNTLSLRIAGISDVEGETALATSDLNDKLMRLAGVTVFDELDGQVRSTFDILTDLNEVWGDLSKNQQLYLGEAIAGKTQIAVFNSIMENFNTVLENSDTAFKSIGSAAKENAAYMDSLEGKVNQVSSAFSILSNNIISSDFIGFLLEGTAGLLSFLNDGINPVITGLGLLGIAFGTLNVISKSVLGAKLIAGFVSLQGAIGGLITTVSTSGTVLAGLSAVFGVVTTSIKASTLAMLSNPLFVGVAIVGTIMGISSAISNMTTQLEKQTEVVENATSKLNTLKGEYDNLSSKTEISANEQTKLKLLETQIQLQEELYQKELETLYLLESQEEQAKKNKVIFNESGMGVSVETINGNKTAIEELIDEYDRLSEVVPETADEFDKIQSEIDEVVNSISEYLGNLDKYADLEGGLSDFHNGIIEDIDRIAESYNKANESVIENVEVMSESESAFAKAEEQMQSLATAIAELPSKLADLESIQAKVNDEYSFSYDEMTELIATYPSLESAIYRTAEGYAIQKGAVEKLITSTQNLESAIPELSARLTELETIQAQVINGYIFSNEEIQGLLAIYPELESAIYRTAEGYGIEQGAVENLIVSTQNLNSVYVAAQNSMSTALKTSVSGRLQNLGIELQGIKTVAEAYAALANARTNFGADAREVGFVGAMPDTNADYSGLLDLNLPSLMNDINVMGSSVSGFEAELSAEISRLESMTVEFESLTGKLNDIKAGSVSGGYAPSSSSSSGSSSSGSGSSAADDELKTLEELEQAYQDLYAEKVRVIEFDKDTSETFSKDYLSGIDTSIKYLKLLQDTAHEEAERLRANGVDENDEYLQSLRTQWHSYYKEINSLQEDYYNEKVRLIKFDLVQAQTYSRDYEKDIKDTIDYLIELQTLAHEEANRLRALGYDNTSEQIQSLKEQWQDYYEEINDLQKSLYSGKIQDMEFDLDTAEFYDASDEERIERIMAMQEEALAEISRMKALGFEENDDYIQSLLKQWRDWQQDIIDIQEEANARILALRKQLLEEMTASINAEIDLLEEKQDALNDIIEMTMDMIRQEKKLEIEKYEAIQDGLSDELSAYKDLIQAKKDSLKASQDERSYQQELSELNSELATLEAELREAQNDDSAEGKARQLELAEKIADKTLDIENLQYDKSIEIQEDALDEELENFESFIDEQKSEYESYIEEVEALLNNEYEIRKEALDRIDNDSEQLYQDLIAYNRQYGDAIDETVTSSWYTAMEAVNAYGSAVAALSGIQIDLGNLNTQLENLTSSDSAVADNAYTQAIVDEMKVNSQAWWNTDNEAERQALEERNQLLGSTIGATISGGTWYKDGQELYSMYHSGGIVGGQPMLQSNEEFAKLLKGEFVATEGMMDNFMRSTLPSMIGSGSTVNNNSSSGDINITIDTHGGDLDSTAVSNLKKYIDTAIDKSSLEQANKSNYLKGNKRSAKSLSI